MPTADAAAAALETTLVRLGGAATTLVNDDKVTHSSSHSRSHSSSRSTSMQSRDAVVAVEAMFAMAVLEVCPSITSLEGGLSATSLARGTVKRQDASKAPEFGCSTATKLFWILRRQTTAAAATASNSNSSSCADILSPQKLPRRKATEPGAETEATITSRLGLRR